MQQQGRGLFIVLALGIFSTVGSAGPAGFRSLAALSKQADAIVVGSARHATTAAPGLSITIEILRVLKGAPVAGEQLQGIWTPAGSSVPPATPGGVVGVWFLQAGDSGQWEILPPMTGDVPFTMTYLPDLPDPPSGVYSVLPGMDPFDKGL